MENFFKKVFFFCCIGSYMAIGQQKDPKAGRQFLKHHFVNYTEVGALFGKAYNISNSYMYSYPVKASTNFTMQTFNGIEIYKNWAIGATVGVDWYSAYQILPVSLGIRKPIGNNPLSKSIQPFLGIDAGYGLTWLSDKLPNQTIDGGVNLNPQIGLLIPTGGNAKFTLSVGYKHNRVKSFQNQGTEEFPSIMENVMKFNRMVVRLGITFK